jgi:hypothetical protein
MKAENRKKYVLMTALMMLLAVGLIYPTVNADSSDVTTTWIVPADDTITISFPTGQGKIEFDCAGQNFSDQGATGQNPTTAAINVTNQGNQALEINASWTAEWYDGVRFVNMSLADNTNATKLTYGDANETVNQTWNASLAQGDSQLVWMWTTGNEAPQTAGADRTLRVWSKAS